MSDNLRDSGADMRIRVEIRATNEGIPARGSQHHHSSAYGMLEVRDAVVAACRGGWFGRFRSFIASRRQTNIPRSDTACAGRT
jgi:hypothetical protein